MTARHPKEAFCSLFETAVGDGRFERLRPHVDADRVSAPLGGARCPRTCGRARRDRRRGGARGQHLRRTGRPVAPNAVLGHDGFEVVTRDGKSRTCATPAVCGSARARTLAPPPRSTRACTATSRSSETGRRSTTSSTSPTPSASGRRLDPRRRCRRRRVDRRRRRRLARPHDPGESAPVDRHRQLRRSAPGPLCRRDVPAHALVIGHTGGRPGWYCLCRAHLDPADDEIVCTSCGRRYAVEGATIRALG